MIKITKENIGQVGFISVEKIDIAAAKKIIKNIFGRINSIDDAGRIFMTTIKKELLIIESTSVVGWQAYNIFTVAYKTQDGERFFKEMMKLKSKGIVFFGGYTLAKGQA